MVNYEFKTVIEESHKRCETMGLSKDILYSGKIIDQIELQKKLAEKRRLIMTAAPYMEELIKIVEGLNFFCSSYRW